MNGIVIMLMAISISVSDRGRGGGTAFDGVFTADADLAGYCLKFDDAGDPNTYLCPSAADEVTLTCGGADVWVCNAAGCSLAGELGAVTSLDATTESTVEAAIDTLANLTSVQGQSVSLSGSLTVESNATVGQDTTTDAAVLFGSVNIGGVTANDLLLKQNTGNVLAVRFGDDSGNATFSAGSVRSSSYVRADASSYIEFNNRGRFYSSADGIIEARFANGADAARMDGSSFSFSGLVAIGAVSKTWSYDDMVDGGGASGTIDFDDPIPDGAIAIRAICVGLTGFTGDTSATLVIGDGTVPGRYNTGTPSVFTTNASGVDLGVVSGTAWHDDQKTPTATVTSNADFTSVSAGTITCGVFFYYGP